MERGLAQKAGQPDRMTKVLGAVSWDLGPRYSQKECRVPGAGSRASRVPSKSKPASPDGTGVLL